MDPVNSVSAAKQLINDVDLSVSKPDLTVLFGNNNHDGDIANNVEMVYLATPVAGKYIVQLRSKIFLAGMPQVVSIVITCDYYVSKYTQSAYYLSSNPTISPSISPSTPTLAPTAITASPVPPTLKPSIAPTMRYNCNAFDFNLHLSGGQKFCTPLSKLHMLKVLIQNG